MNDQPKPPADEPAPCAHPDRGAEVRVTCPHCHSPVRLPADRPDAVTDRTCPVCRGQLPWIPEARP